ncbi:hypothetical protein DFH08DRAFT_822382 [Mycena albidolilacea]|uniref:Uncharacterized protein n=1 Tax=Mycena albidolilacea TaxID=1033008 RepID=A0AAD6Z8R9_9AGAR|nr:hypothetical protein DFH08DRAFT_822382 [Mycena albidolilacea]
MAADDINPTWLPIKVNEEEMFMCTVCNDGRTRRGYNLSRHEETDAHKSNVVHLSSATITQTKPEPSNHQYQQIPDDALRHLLSSLTRGTVAPYPEASTDSPPTHSGINWNLMEANSEGNLSLSADQQAVASIAEAILARFADLPMSDDEFAEWSDDEETPSNEPEVAGIESQIVLLRLDSKGLQVDLARST